MIKNIIARFLLVYAIILSAINLFVITFGVVAPYFKVRFNFDNYWNGYHYWIGFMIIYFIELIISSILAADNDHITLNNMRKIIPQIILSVFYLIMFFLATFSLHIVLGLPFLLTATSLFFSHLFVTGYLGNTKSIIFWKIISSLNSFLVLTGMPLP